LGPTVVASVNWQAVTAVATIIYASAATLGLVGLVIILKQLKATDEARTLEALSRIYENLHTDQAKADRRAIYNSKLDQLSDSDFEESMRTRTLPGASLGVGQELALESIERTADLWHLVGVLAKNELVEKEVLFDYFSWPLLNSFCKMRHYIRWVRCHRNPAYADHFVSIATDFEDRFKRKSGEAAFLRRFGVSTLKDA